MGTHSTCMRCKPQSSTKSPYNCAADPPPSKMPVGQGRQEGNGETMALNKTAEDDGAPPPPHTTVKP
jgi:hypothetical protein